MLKSGSDKQAEDAKPTFKKKWVWDFEKKDKVTSAA